MLLSAVLVPDTSLLVPSAAGVAQPLGSARTAAVEAVAAVPISVGLLMLAQAGWIEAVGVLGAGSPAGPAAGVEEPAGPAPAAPDDPAQPSRSTGVGAGLPAFLPAGWGAR